MNASLPMYDLPPQQRANDEFWQAIRKYLQAGPATLTRKGNLWDHWLSPGLILSQTCGYPYRAKLHDKVTLVGTPDYGLEGCPPGYYCSVFIARADNPRLRLEDFAEARFAYNEALSQSGWAAPQHHVAQFGFQFQNLVETGAHRQSALAVLEGSAELAALDALTWKLLQRNEPFPAVLREVARTEPTPALPYITHKEADPAPIYAAIEAGIEDLHAIMREALSLKGMVSIPPEDYLAVPTPAGPAPQHTP